MTVLQSLVVDGFGFAVVFSVLIALSLVIKLISVIISSAQKKAPVSDTVQEQESVQAAQFADGELKLFEVDEKTAALIMAIVSDESGIPLSQLRFQSIRLMK